jgi:hypothetical protein|tara:strand:- start:763 stop:1278 length:516 start_codon:yes stop_codon:yes gene_type:complete
MATPLFISRNDLVKNTIIDGSVDTDKLLPFIKISQQMHIQNYLGSELYNKISALITAGTLTDADNPDYFLLVNEYVQPMLIMFSMVDYMPFSNYAVKQGGTYRHRSENAELPSKNEIDFLVQKYRDFADFYTRRFIDYMNYNASTKFPEYYSNSNDDMYPDGQANWVGWVL